METDFLENTMPCHNQQMNNNVNDSQEHAAKQVRFSNSGSQAQSEPFSDGDSGHRNDTVTLSSEYLIGPQLKLLPLNDQIRELQTIIRDK